MEKKEEAWKPGLDVESYFLMLAIVLISKGLKHSKLNESSIPHHILAELDNFVSHLRSHENGHPKADYADVLPDKPSG